MWLLRRDVAAKFERWLELGIKPTEAQLAKFLERGARASSASSTPYCLTIAGDVAEIRVAGVLTPQPDFWAWLFYGENTSYAEIREALALAAAEPLVKRVEFHVDSPGGNVAGLFETLGAIEAFDTSKKRSVRAALACSAAFAIAAVAGRIEATSIAAEFGSIGVVQTYYRYADETIINITSTEAPDKRPDPETPEGQAVIRRELDAIHEIFVDAIARGRTNAGKETSVEQINTDYGRGAVVLARDAMARGMIDKAPPRAARAGKKTEDDEGEPERSPEPKGASGEESRTENTIMNLEQLKAQHPDLYAAVVAEGETKGQANERKRVLAHLKLGKSSGAMAVAEKAIADGSSTMDEGVFAEYQSASMNRRDQENRQADSDAAENTVKGAKPPSSDGAKDAGDRMADAMGLPEDPGPKGSKAA